MEIDRNVFNKLKPVTRLSIKRSIADRYPRNAKCPCRSGKKYKHCCWSKGNEPGPDFVTPETELHDKKEVTYANKRYARITKKDDAGKLQKPSVILEA